MNIAKKKTADIDFVIPVYKNGDSLIELTERLHRVLDIIKISHSILYVVDACPLNSLSIIKKICTQDKRVRYISLKKNAGQQKATMIGLHFVQGKNVVLMDADLQDPPERIPELFDKMKDGYEIVFAGRRGKYESRLRLFTSRFFKWLIHHISSIPKDAGFFMIISKQVVNRLKQMSTKHPFLPVMTGFSKLPAISLPVTRDIRKSGKTSYKFNKRLIVAIKAINLSILFKLRLVRSKSPMEINKSDFTPYIKEYYGFNIKKDKK